MQRTLYAPALLLLLACGCGDGRPTRAPVAGQVLIDGQPVPFGMVKFVQPETRAASGRLDSEGRFTLSCFEKNDGAIPGVHKVSITATEGINERTTRWHAPKKYANENTSGIEITIDGATDDLVIDLTWDGKGPFIEKQ
ncbi:hypothetical protein Pla108_17900 [Botrimarina colliarenosi]|uniref:Carboxypeptidase regulatory-like domain-containing protein n=1 Tax=Botrimarina colliarenosi TaxID=2528001 RepID=A0A5C6AEA1_9BACT|nr:hypothetical protein [Botrimarina colliarenosi]TWT97638.1 hypothetical protein Pla108_17900 [Botrimarina colliarenosi]